MDNSRWKDHHHIHDRYIIEGTLELETPAHFGNGDVGVGTDMPVARDTETNQPLLTGASIAGALRHYLHADEPNLARELFGNVNEDDVLESALLVNDAVAENAGELELRDGVAIDGKTRTAEDGKKFDIELIPAGTRFELVFELNVTQAEKELVSALAFTLRGLEKGEIALGKRKTRGLGVCKVKTWRMRHYNVTQPQDLMAWLNDDKTREKSGSSITALLGLADTEFARAARAVFSINTDFRLDGSLMIRAEGTTSNSPDNAHLHSKRNGNAVPILSGTSLAGALRARALRIANTLATNMDQAPAFVDAMFGPHGGKDIRPAASRVRVSESVIEESIRDLVQNRVKLDRFTGGASPTALFSEQPVFGLPETRVYIELELIKAHDPEQVYRAKVGLLLLLLKDLWTGDLPLGGETSVGRGRLRGVSANLKLDGVEWKLQDQQGKLSIEGEQQILEQCVQEFVGAMKNA